MSTLLAIDPVKLGKSPPANSGGWAMLHDRIVVNAGHFYETSDLADYHHEYVAYEWPAERGKASPVPVKDLLDLCWCCVSIAAMYNADAIKVPVSWKRSVPKKAFHRMILGKLTAEERYLLDQQLPGVPDYKADNIIDAVGVGLHAVGRGIF